MDIAFCTPFKALDNPRPSGDVSIAKDLVAALQDMGHTVTMLPHYPSQWIYWRPWRWNTALRALGDMTSQANRSDCVLTYNSYYKAPDVFGPDIAKTLGIPYFIFSASYAPKRGRAMKTMIGHWLNKRAILNASHLFCNRAPDYQAAAQILPPHAFSPVPQGLRVQDFQHNAQARQRLRQEWGIENGLVLCTAAMMRPGVKTQGIQWVLQASAALAAQKIQVLTVIAGDGPEKIRLQKKAQELGLAVRFLGQVPREMMPEIYSAADFFAFPGIKESIGMVYLEAQSCGLPVVATDDEGAPQVVAHNSTGLICQAREEAFCQAVVEMARSTPIRQAMALRAPSHVRHNHGLPKAYASMAKTMSTIVEAGNPWVKQP